MSVFRIHIQWAFRTWVIFRKKWLIPNLYDKPIFITKEIHVWWEIILMKKYLYLTNSLFTKSWQPDFSLLLRLEMTGLRATRKRASTEHHPLPGYSSRGRCLQTVGTAVTRSKNCDVKMNKNQTHTTAWYKLLLYKRKK